MLESLWGTEFNVSEDDIQSIIKRKKPKTVKEVSVEKRIKSKSTSVYEKIDLIKNDVNRILGSYKEETICLRDKESLHDYITKAIENDMLAVDTETNNTLDTIDGQMMGLCLYTPGMKNAYVPVNHCEFTLDEKGQVVLGDLLQDQLTYEDIKEELDRLGDTKLIFHNATFDMEVIYSTCKILLKPYWDTQTGAVLLNENELKGLKAQYKMHINPEQDKYDIEHLFKGLPYAIFDPDLFALYAATDSKITHDLYLYQMKEFIKPENKDLLELMETIEVPILTVIAKMELNGVVIDTEYAERMSKIYHAKLDEIQTRIDAELLNLKPLVDQWRLSPEANVKLLGKTGKQGKSKNEQLADPIELGSSTQMAILLYDILKVPTVDKKKPRTTDADALETLANDKHIKICELLLEKREVDILINTFIDKVPEFIASDGKVHARFNSTGTKTGRFSSTEPNLQQIPSHDPVIRMMFKAEQGQSIIGADYSGQEVRVLASVSKDKKLIDNYEQKKDPYATIASICFKTPYENCLEFHPETHALQPDGKARRSKGKTLLLGLNYGMSVKSLAERIGETEEGAQKIVDDYYSGFEGIGSYTKQSQEMLKKLGYVTDAWGRRRHLPDAQLPQFDVHPTKGFNTEFNPLLDVVPHEDKALQAKIRDYIDRLSKTKWKKDRDIIVEQAKKDGLSVMNNGGFINRSLRQCLNARIQGSSASMTKLAMIMVDNDPELKSLGFKLLVTVHDEMFGSAPTENAVRAGDRLCEVMVEAAKSRCGNVAWKCDPYICVDGWYEDVASGSIKNDYTKLIAKLDEEEALNKLSSKYSMFDANSVISVCKDKYNFGKDSLKYGCNYYK